MIVATIISIMLSVSPITSLHAQSAESSGAAGGISAGTAVAIGIVGAALLIALGDSSSSAAQGVTAAGGSVAAGSGNTDAPISTDTTTATSTTADTSTTTTTTTTTTTSN
tara:strand:- start:210 stop:539 length:330 start_codon:yes stop_codon:yes gene_type:complete